MGLTIMFNVTSFGCSSLQLVHFTCFTDRLQRSVNSSARDTHPHLEEELEVIRGGEKVGDVL